MRKYPPFPPRPLTDIQQLEFAVAALLDGSHRETRETYGGNTVEGRFVEEKYFTNLVNLMERRRR